MSLEGSGLVLSSELLDLVLEVFLGLSGGGDLGLLDDSLLDESVLWFEFPQRVLGSVDESEGAGGVATEFGSQAEDDDLFQRGVVLFGDQLLQVLFGAD